MSNFYIRFIKKDNQTQIEYLRELGKDAPKFAPTVAKEVRDRRIVTILRKYLDMEFKSGQMNVFDKVDFQTLGELLFDLIFHDQSLNIEFNNWYNSLSNDDDKAESHNIFLEFEQELEFDDLAILPWEYIYFNPREKGKNLDEPFLAVSPKTKINFYRKFPIVANDAFDKEKFELKPPLKILLIISNPNPELKLTKLDELLLFFNKLKIKFPDDEKLQIKYLYQPNHLEFTSELNDGKNNKSEKYLLDNLGDKIKEHDDKFLPDIIHIVAHGSVEGKNGMLIFTEEDLYADKFNPVLKSDEWFSNCLKNSKLKPKLVFLQICNGARIVSYINNKGTAICLLNNNIPYVIAMQNPVQESHALQFAQIFYNNFLLGENIGTCVAKGRHSLGNDGLFTEKAFGSPVLFTYLKFPLKLNISNGFQQNMGDGEKEEEEIIKYCNFPGCPQYGDEKRYTPTDIMCTQGHRLVSKKKETVSADTSTRMGGAESADYKMVYEKKSSETSISSSRDSRAAESSPPSIGNGFTREVRKLRD